jgi:hypothetical protein
MQEKLPLAMKKSGVVGSSFFLFAGTVLRGRQSISIPIIAFILHDSYLH